MAHRPDRRRFAAAAGALGFGGAAVWSGALAQDGDGRARLQRPARPVRRRRRPASTRRRSATCTRTASSRHIFEAPARLRPAGACRCGCVPLHGRGDARGIGRLHDLDGAAAAAASASPTTRRSRAGRASWSLPTTSTRSSASTIRPPRARTTARSTKTASSASTPCASARCATSKPFDYRAEVEGLRALDRYTIQFKLATAAAALRDDAVRVVCRRASRAKWSRLRRRHHGAPGRHRAVPPQVVAAQLAHRARAQPELPRRPLRQRARRRRRRRAGLGEAAATASACRSTTASRSPSSRRTSRAG